MSFYYLKELSHWQCSNCRPSLIAELANGNLNCAGFNKNSCCQGRNTSHCQLPCGPPRRYPIFEQNTNSCSQPQAKTKPMPCTYTCPPTACERDGNVIVIPICFSPPQPQIIMPATTCCCPCPCQSKVKNFSVLDQLIPGKMQSYEGHDACGSSYNIQTDPIYIDPCTMSCCRTKRVGIEPEQRKSRTRSPSPDRQYNVWPNLPLPTRVPGVDLNPIPSDDTASEEEFEQNDTGYYYWNEQTKRFEPGEPPTSTSTDGNERPRKKSKEKESSDRNQRRSSNPQRNNVERQAHENDNCSCNNGSNEYANNQQQCNPPSNYCVYSPIPRQQSPICCCYATQSSGRPQKFRSGTNARIPVNMRSDTEGSSSDINQGLVYESASMSNQRSRFSKDAQTQVNKSCINCCSRNQQQHYQCLATQQSHSRCSSRSSFEDKSFTFFCEHKKRQVNNVKRSKP